MTPPVFSRIAVLVSVLQFLIRVDIKTLIQIFEVSTTFREALLHYSHETLRGQFCILGKRPADVMLQLDVEAFVFRLVSRCIVSGQNLWLLHLLFHQFEEEQEGSSTAAGKCIAECSVDDFLRISFSAPQCEKQFGSWRPITVAVRRGPPESVRVLLELGASPAGILAEAAQHERLDVLHTILQMHDERRIPQINFEDEQKNGLLHAPIRLQNSEILALLAKRKEIDVNCAVTIGSKVSPLQFALRDINVRTPGLLMPLLANDSCSIDIANALLLSSIGVPHVAVPGTKSKKRVNLLHVLAITDKLDLMKLALTYRRNFLERSYDVGENADAEHFGTPLFLAIEDGSCFAMVELLLNNGARVDYEISIQHRGDLIEKLPPAAGEKRLAPQQPALAIALALSRGKGGGGPFSELLRMRVGDAAAVRHLLNLRYIE